LIITVFFVLAWGLSGALYAMAVMPFFLFFIALIYVRKFDWLGFEFVSYKFDSTIVKKLSSFSLMAINNAIVGSVAQIFIRFMIIKKITIEEAGFWDSMLKISSAYMLLITTSIQIYFLPTLSAIKEPHLLWKMISKVNKIIIPSVIFCLAILYLFRQQVVLVLFSKEFLPITDLFLLQMIGDIIKVVSWSFAYLMYAKAMTKVVILSDNIFTLTYLIGIYFSVDYLNLEGVYISNIINNLIYLGFIYLFIKKHLFKNQYLNV
jgi:PST family polysaccharide transporter